MRVSQASFLTGIAFAIGLLAAGIIASYAIDRWPDQRPSWVPARFSEAPEWFQGVETLGNNPEDRPRLMALLDRGVRDGVAVAGCMKALYLVSEFVDTGSFDRREFSQLPQLLQPYRMEECPGGPIILATAYKYGLGVEHDTAMTQHYLRKVAMLVGHGERTADIYISNVFGVDSRYDLSKELRAAAKWFHDEFMSLTPAEKLAVAEDYLSGTTVPRDMEMGFRLLLAMTPAEHNGQYAYRAALAVEDKRISYAPNWRVQAAQLMRFAADQGVLPARRMLGAELYILARGDEEKLLHAYAFTLWAKDIGERMADVRLSTIEWLLGRTDLEPAARELIVNNRLKSYAEFERTYQR